MNIKRVNLWMAVMVAILTFAIAIIGYGVGRVNCDAALKQREMSVNTSDSYTSTHINLTVKVIGSNKNISLLNQELPDVPICNIKIRDTIRLCKSYGETSWHVEQYHNKYGSEVDHCEDMTNATVVSIDGISVR